jgi:hypothetical protein
MRKVSLVEMELDRADHAGVILGVLSRSFSVCTYSSSFQMPSLLLIVFLLQLSIHLVNTIGAPVINELVRTSFTSLSLSPTLP